MKRYIVIFIVLSSYLGVYSHDQATGTDPGDSKGEKADSILKSYFLDGRFNGSVLIAGNSGLIYSGTYGYSQLNSKKKLDDKSIFCLASVSKVITSTAILRLYEEGKLELSDLLPEYFPDLPDSYKDVSIKHLLTHTSGIPDFHKQPVREVYNSDIYRFLKKQEKLEFYPGSRYSYSSSGFILLAMIIEKVSGISYPEYLQKEFFKPLGMDNTFVNKSRKKSRIVTSYHVSGKVDDRPNYFYGSGEIYSTAGDMLKWDRAVFGGELISRELMAQAFIQNKLDDGTPTYYGLGWGVLPSEGQTIVGHTGGNYGFRTIYEHNLDSGLTLIMLTNIGDKCPTMEIRTRLIQLFD